MSWIQENKFVAGLAGVTLVAGGAILFLGLKQGSAYDEKLEDYQAKQAKLIKLEKKTPYPSETNLEERETGRNLYETSVKEVRDLVAAYRPAKLENMTPEQFKDVQVKMEEDLRSQFAAAKTELPENCLFGFEEYASSSVNSLATAKLNYELGAIQWLMSKLADAKPSKINNINRAELPEEKGIIATTSKPKPRTRKHRSSRTPAQNVYELMPVEISFTAHEATVRQFLKAIVNSKEYYYAIRGIRISNERQQAPNKRDANFPEPTTTDSAFEDISGFLDSEPEAATQETNESAAIAKPSQSTEAEGELILKQILGSEKLHVHLCFDILLIKEKSPEPKK